ncbi:MAG: ECF transporter S component [Azoarcus sp.]|jgi:riboflavin transporter FmnP|nr:ECF transporter S component [Azoarcus sp.]
MPEKNLNVKSRTMKLAKMGRMLAVAVICSFVRFPILPAATYLQFELSDIPILIAGFVFGPLPGLVIGVASIVLNSFMPSFTGNDGVYGIIMHVLSTGSYVLTAGLIYSRKHSRLGAGLALKLGRKDV